MRFIAGLSSVVALYFVLTALLLGIVGGDWNFQVIVGGFVVILMGVAIATKRLDIGQR